MKISSFTFGSLSTILCFMYSCSKSESFPSATITIYSPLTDQVFHQGEAIEIEALIKGEAPLHGYKLAVTSSSGDTLFKADDHSHALELAVNQVCVVTAARSDNLLLHISSEINHEGLNVTKTLPFKIEM